MKTYCKHLRLDRDFVAKAFIKWARKDAGRKNLWRVYKEYGCPENLIEEIADEVRCRMLDFEPIRRYWHKERQGGKVRHIGVESVKQQVFDYVLNEALEPLYRAKIGFWQVASIENKGMIMAKNACQKGMRKHRWFVHLDVKQDYKSTRLDICERILRKYVRSDDVLYGVHRIFLSYEHGLEIGSPFSLKMNQLYLSFAYHFLEDQHVFRRGKSRLLVKKQLWYADDIFLFADSKKDLKKAISRLSDFMSSKLDLRLKRWKISSCNQETLDAMAYRVDPATIKVRGNIYIRGARAFQRFRKRRSLKLAYRVVSYWGYMKHARLHKFISEHNAIKTVKDAKRTISIWTRKKGANERENTVIYGAPFGGDLADDSWLCHRVA